MGTLVKVYMFCCCLLCTTRQLAVVDVVGPGLNPVPVADIYMHLMGVLCLNVTTGLMLLVFASGAW